MSSAAAAYARNAQQTLSPRELEAHLLMKAASKFQALREDWSKAPAELKPALLYNRKLWTVFVTSVTDEKSALPAPVRQNVANLGIFVFKRTVEIEQEPSADKLGVLIEINRNLAQGLRRP